MTQLTRRGLRSGARWWLLTIAGLLVALAATIWAAQGMAGPWRFAILPPVSVCLVAMTLTSWPVVLGALGRLGLRGPVLLPPARDPGSRTAILVPIHNEDPAHVFAALRAMRGQVDAADLDGIEFFVLSDSRDPDIAREEEAQYASLPPHGAPVTYRRRLANAGRKAGNIADFCARWGGAFDYMLVLDADSVMGAGAIERMVGLMDANPRAGLIQSVPYCVNRETLHARMFQFAMRLYTPLWAEGAALWFGSEANYWGHNAIIRIAPFMRHARLPVLPGRAPLGGEILCHDVVEAALLRAAGWETWLAPAIADSFEELPPNMADDAARERRWCQGNVQHIGLLARAGLRASGRLHLGSGVLYYLGAPCWVLIAALFSVAPAAFAEPALRSLAWPVLALWGVPKLLHAAAALADHRRVRGFGGRASLLASLFAEQALGMLTAPASLLASARFVLTTLAGRVVRWDAQPRADRGVDWREAWDRFGWQAIVGVTWSAALLARGNPTLLAWAAPIAAGLVAGIPIAVWTSRQDWGRAARRLGLFLTTDEMQPSAVLRAYRSGTATPIAVPAVPEPARALAGQTADGVLT